MSVTEAIARWMSRSEKRDEGIYGKVEDLKLVSSPLPVPINAVDQTDIKPGRVNISFNSGLVDKLKDDHQKLIKICLHVNAACDKDDFNLIPKLVATFDREFKSHVIHENLFFYAYLEDQLASSETYFDVLSVMREMKSDMRPIASFVKTFCKKWVLTKIDHSNVKVFKQEFLSMMSALNDRVDLEENTLYPMYLPYKV